MIFKKKGQVESTPPPPLYTETPQQDIALTLYSNELFNFRSRIKRIGEVHKDIPIDLIYTALTVLDSSKVDELNLSTHFRFQFVRFEDYSRFDYTPYKKLRSLCKKDEKFDQILQLSRKNFINEINSYIKQQKRLIENITEYNPNLNPILKYLNYDKLFKSLNEFIVIDPTEINEALFYSNNGNLIEKHSTHVQIESNDIIKLIEQYFINNTDSYYFDSQAIIKTDKLRIENKENNQFSFQLFKTVKCDLNKVLILTIKYSAKVHIDKSFKDIIDTVLNHYEIRYRLLWLLPSDKDFYSNYNDRTLYALLEVDDLNKIGDYPLIYSDIDIRNNTIKQK